MVLYQLCAVFSLYVVFTFSSFVVLCFMILLLYVSVLNVLTYIIFYDNDIYNVSSLRSHHQNTVDCCFREMNKEKWFNSNEITFFSAPANWHLRI